MFSFFETKLVSVVICNKNSLAILKNAIESLKKQTYKKIEVIIIDGQSTDGSLEFLENQKKYLNLKIISEADSGISEAYSKGLSQASGDIVGILAADERYYPYTIKKVVQWFAEYPKNIVCGGACKFLNKDEIEVDSYLDDYLDLERHLTCEHICAILPSFFNKKLLGKDLFYKLSQKTCPDYDLWARLALKYSKERFSWLDFPIAKALRTDSSMSFRDSGFKGMVEDKIAYLKEFLAENSDVERLKTISFNRCAAGIHMWAAEQIIYIKHDSDAVLYHCNQAYLLDRHYPRILDFVNQNDFSISDTAPAISRYSEPEATLETVSNSFNISIIPDSGSVKKSTDPLQIITSHSAWGYSAEISFDQNLKNAASLSHNMYWVIFILNVDKGSVGISKIKNNHLVGERIVSKPGEQRLCFKIHEKCFNYNFMVRSGGESESLVTITKIEIVKTAR